MTTTQLPLDHDVQTSWRTFRSSVAEAVAGLAPGAETSVELGSAYGDCLEYELWATPAVDLRAHGQWVSVSVPNNQLLDERFRMSRAQLRVLRDLGLRRDPTSYTGVFPRRLVEQVADVVTRYFRDVVGVLEPCFLDRVDDEGRLAAPVSHEPAAHLVCDPSTPEHLDALVREALDDVLAFPGLDEDGDFTVEGEFGTFWVRPRFEAGTVRFWRYLSPELDDLDAALELVNTMNLHQTLVHVQVRDGMLLALMDVPCHPCSPEGLRALTDRFDAQSAWLAREARDHWQSRGDCRHTP